MSVQRAERPKWPRGRILRLQNLDVFQCLFIQSSAYIDLLLHIFHLVLCRDGVILNNTLSPFLFSCNLALSFCNMYSTFDSLIICTIISNVLLCSKLQPWGLDQEHVSLCCITPLTLAQTCGINVRRGFHPSRAIRNNLSD